MLTNLDLIIADIISKLTDEDRDILSGENHSYDRGWFDSMFQRWIRNEYNLWHDSPLTQVWRDNPDTRVMKDGVDWSYYHPDAVSSRIARKVEHYLSFYPGRPIEVTTRIGKWDDGGRNAAFTKHPCHIIKRTKSGLIEIALTKYPKKRVSVTEGEIEFV